jgi:hypothetical protein
VLSSRSIRTSGRRSVQEPSVNHLSDRDKSCGQATDLAIADPDIQDFCDAVTS